MLKPAADKRATPRVSVVIVSHDSDMVLDSCLRSLQEQSVRPSRVVIVDSGSSNAGYLSGYGSKPDWVIQLEDNIGFSAANNRGLSLCPEDSEFVLFTNPDTILPKNTLEYFSALLAEMDEVAMITGPLLGYDHGKDQPTGRYDSTGVFRSWYGKWYDRDQGVQVGAISRQRSFVPVICGAFMFCRRTALQDETELFDEAFFMYKEDIDLCLRLQKKGWKFVFDPGVEIYHGRGWATDRNVISRQIRLMAARNEIRLNVKHPTPYIIWALLKYGLVKLFNV